MIKVLLDTNIILDILLKRIEFYKESIKILKLSENKEIIGCLTATTITDIYYLTKKQYGHNSSLTLILNILQYINVLPVNQHSIYNAFNSKITDFEDAIQVETAKENNVDLIITRNIKDFKNSTIKVLTPTEFTKLF